MVFDIIKIMEFKKNEIIIKRELSELDFFTLKFINILKKHSEYAVISGYVAIVLGRARASEDVHMIILRMDYEKFIKLLNDIKKAGFYCLNTEDEKEAYDYLKDNLAVRFAEKEKVIPNIEMKFAKNKIDEISLKNKIRVRLGKDEIITSSLEMQVAFKEGLLKSQKDIEDARHIRNIANLDESLIKRYKAMINEVYR